MMRYLYSLTWDVVLCILILWAKYDNSTIAVCTHGVVIGLLGALIICNLLVEGAYLQSGKPFKNIFCLPAWFNLLTDLLILYALFNTGHIFMGVAYYISSAILNLGLKRERK